MGQLVRQQSISGLRCWRKLTTGEGDVVAQGEGTRVDRACDLVGGAIRVEADLREVGTESRLEESP